MALFQSLASDASSGGGTGAFSPESLESRSEKLVGTRSAFESQRTRTQNGRANPAGLGAQLARRSRSDKGGPGERCAENSRAELSVVRCFARVFAIESILVKQPKSARRIDW